MDNNFSFSEKAVIDMLALSIKMLLLNPKQKTKDKLDEYIILAKKYYMYNIHIENIDLHIRPYIKVLGKIIPDYFVTLNEEDITLNDYLLILDRLNLIVIDPSKIFGYYYHKI